jgi:hypothetical protein
MSDAGVPSPKRTPIGFHYVWAFVASAAYAAVEWRHKGHSLLATIDEQTRSALYISLAATAGALLGFAITAITILLTLGGGRRIEWLYRNETFDYVRKIFFGAIHALAFTTIYFSAMIVADTAEEPKPPFETAAVFFLVLALLRVYRVVRLLSDLLELAIKDQRDQQSGAAQRINPPFREPLDDPHHAG